MSTVSNCYESVLWLQSHMLPCNFGETPMFWNPVRKVACRACARIPDVTIPWFAELSEWTCIRRTVWFVELAYRACVSHARNPYVNSSAVNQREYRTFDVIKSIAIECVRVQPSVHKVSTILSAVMDSPSCSDGPTLQDADWVTIVSVTQVPILTQTRFYQPVNELNLTMKVAVNRPQKQYRPQGSWFASFVQIWWF